MNVTKQLYQWDTGQKLTECTGIYVDYLIGDEVYRVEITDGTCIIPDELLQTSGRYKVWECMADNTLREFAFKVLPRPIPPNYVFTPTEQLTFEGLVQKETNKFNTNAIEKLNAYNANADNRVAEFNAQTEQIQTDVSELKSDLTYDKRWGISPTINVGRVNLYTGEIVADSNYQYFRIWSDTIPTLSVDYHSVAFWKNGSFVGGYAKSNIPDPLPSFDTIAIIFYNSNYQTGDIVIIDDSVVLTKINNLDTSITALSDELTLTNIIQSPYSDWSKFSNEYLNGNGVVTPNSNTYLSDYVEVISSTNVEYEIRLIGKSQMMGIAWYDKNKTRIGGFLYPEGSATWYNVSGTLTLPNNAKYIRYCGQKGTDVEQKCQYVTFSAPKSMNSAVTELTQKSNYWAGKKWVAFGTSITDTNNTDGVGGTATGKYAPYLQELSGMSLNNYGISGGSIGVVSGVLSGNI